MKMKHVMAALLFGVVAVGAVQAQEKHYKYYPVTTEVYGGEIINTADLNESCRMGVNSYNDLWIEPYHGFQVGNGKFQQRWTDYTQYGIPNRQLMCSYQQRSKSDSGGWTEWVDSGSTVVAGFSCRDGGRFLWGDKDFCAEEVSEEEYNKNACDPSYYANGVLPADCPKPEPDEKACAKARLELLNKGTPLPEGCSEFGMDPLCKDIRYEHGVGVVACDSLGEPKAPCFLSYKLDEAGLSDSRIRQMLGQCILRHEQKHLDMDVGACKSGLYGPTNEEELNISEYNGLNVESICLEEMKEKCGNDARCAEMIDIRKREIDNYRDHYKNQIH